MFVRGDPLGTLEPGCARRLPRVQFANRPHGVSLEQIAARRKFFTQHAAARA
jgi:hypothetical protein